MKAVFARNNMDRIFQTHVSQDSSLRHLRTTILCAFRPDVYDLTAKAYALSRVIGRLERRADMTSRQLAAMVGVWLKSVGKNQSRGVVSMLDLRECGGSEAVDLFKRCLEE